MTQKELEELVGVTRQTIMTIEKSKHSQTLLIKLRLATWQKQ
jgi:DNA-binding XRE family transcriptional regulator